MAGFIYFAAGWVNPITPEALAALGLTHAFSQPPAHGKIDGRTPSGGVGTILADVSRMPNGELAFRGDEQTWRKRPGDDCVWVGFWNAHRPTPEGLARAKQLPGPLVSLGDGHRWRVPLLLAYQDEGGFAVNLPCYADLSDDGRWVNGAVAAEHAPSQQLAERLYEGLIKAETGQGARLSAEEALTLSVRLLAVNYAVGDVEAAMLRLFTVDSRLRDIVKAAADWQTFVDWYEKKKAGSAPAGSDG